MGVTIKDLREWLKIVPEDYDDCQVIFREIMKMDDDDPQLIAGDDPIVGLSIDVETREACFYNKESQDIIDKIPD
ncbi:MAG: hypothetical protein EHM34_03895 [Nitrosopumilales archaeon]|nr:MAG: hypothetical protein EHM34_03895 [Nitrosopumilales archaeon]